jgi:NadR type nicotinamide-nucleotide adenylyltransferase
MTTTGLLLGKFLPPHLGHKYLIDFARHYVDRLNVQVCSVASEPIPGALRFRWVRDAFGAVADVVHNDDPNPQAPEDDPEHFWDIWRESLLRRVERAPDYVFASETYGFQLAETLGARFIPVDIDRSVVPVSGTAIRDDPMGHWEYILPEARPYFLRRVALVGPESSGKTTLSARLAAHFDTVWVPEYGRTWCDAWGMDDLGPAALASIARGHRASEEALAPRANRVLICDTEAVITKLWSQHFAGSVPPEVEAMARDDRYDLYLLLAATPGWVDDGSRVHSDYADRKAFERSCRAELDALGRRYVVLDGTLEERFAQAVTAVTDVIAGGRHRTDGSDVYNSTR